MSEYIITDEQLKTAAEAYSEHELSLPITEVFISGDKLPEIVRCRDCAKADYAEVHMFDGTRQKKWTCTRFECFHHMVKPDGFCSWGARREP